MITVGVDLAAEPKNTALARIEWATGRATLRSLIVGVTDSVVVDHSCDATRIGIDSPLGWPGEFIDFVTAHRDARPLPVDDAAPGWRSPLTNRRADLAVSEYTKRELGKAIRPLSVSADLLGHVALRCAALQVRLRGAGVEIDRSGVGGHVAEVYPAASLALWGIASRSYKGRDGAQVREHALHTLRAQAPWLEFTPDHAALCARVDHAFDAVVCALAARAVASSRSTAPPPGEVDRYSTEGWVHLPTVPLAELVDSVATTPASPAS